MGMAAISAMSWPPIRTARLAFFKREPPHSGHGTVALSLTPFAALGDLAQAVAARTSAFGTIKRKQAGSNFRRGRAAV